MRARALIVALPAVVGIIWLGVVHGNATRDRSDDAATVRERVEVGRAATTVATALRRVEVDLTVAEAADRPLDPENAAVGALADATNALQRRLGQGADALTRSERAEWARFGREVGRWGGDLPDAETSEGGAARPVDAAAAFAGRLADLRSSLAVASGEAGGPLLALDRLDRAAQADTEVYLIAIDALGRPPSERSGVARAITAARRAAADAQAAATAAASAATRTGLDRLGAGTDDALLAAFGDDETVRTLTSTPDELGEGAAARVAAWTRLESKAADAAAATAAARSTAAARADRSAWELGATWLLLALGIGLIASGRVGRPDADETDAAESVATSVRPADTSGDRYGTIDEPSPAYAPAVEAIVACLAEFASRHRDALHDQLDLLEALGVGRGGGTPDALVDSLDASITRIRRLTESVLVLTATETPRGDVGDLAVGDVVAAAVGELGSAAAVTVGGSADRVVRGDAVVDIAHLVAELADLGSFGGEPGTVDVKISESDADMVTVMVEHRGAVTDGIDPEVLRRALEGEWVSGGIGWLAAGVLARRHGVAVSIDPAPGSEVIRVAAVVPATVLVDRASPDQSAQEASGMIWGWTESGEYLPATGWRPDGEFVAPPARLADAVPSGAAFDAGLESLLEGGRSAPAGTTGPG